MLETTGQIPAKAQALDEQCRLLFTLLNDLPAIVYLRAPDYSIHFANRYFRQRFGDPTVGPCYRIIHHRGGQALTSPVLQLKLLQEDAAGPERLRAGLGRLMGEAGRPGGSCWRLRTSPSARGQRTLGRDRPGGTVWDLRMAEDRIPSAGRL
jgi:hypothetical protein